MDVCEVAFEALTARRAGYYAYLIGLAVGVECLCLLCHLSYHGFGYAVGGEATESDVVSVVDECCAFGSGNTCISHNEMMFFMFISRCR